MTAIDYSTMETAEIERLAEAVVLEYVARQPRVAYKGIAASRKGVLSAAGKFPRDVPFLLIELKSGRVNGRTYRCSPCGCLWGTIAKSQGRTAYDLPKKVQLDGGSPAEVWFGPIRPGDTPANNPVVALTVRWIEEWQAKREVVA